MATLKIMDGILDELDRAERKHPAWPNDVIHQVAILNEETGEAVEAFAKLRDAVIDLAASSGKCSRAALQLVYEGGTIEDLKNELYQNGAMVVRCLKNLEGVE